MSSYKWSTGNGSQRRCGSGLALQTQVCLVSDPKMASFLDDGECLVRGVTIQKSPETYAAAGKQARLWYYDNWRLGR